MKFVKVLLSVFCVGLIAGCVQQQELTEQAEQAEQMEEQELFDTVTVVNQLVIDENSVPIFPKKAALTTDAARHFSVELPMRCEVDWDNQSVVTVVPSEKIEMIRLGVGDELPKLKVSNYGFKKLTVKKALDKLLEGTDISVVEYGELHEKVTGSISSGNLADAIELITKMGRVYYSYDAHNGELNLTHRAKWLIKMPQDQTVIMALLDAMHGADMRNLLVDWKDKTVVFEGNYQTEREVAKIISDISGRKYVLAWDMDVYRVYPRTDNPIVWMNLLPAFGEKNVRMSIPGVVGRALVVGPEINTKTLQEFLMQQANVVLVSQGTFAIPNGWQSRFDIGQCGREERLETDLIVGALGTYGDYGGRDKIDAKIVLRTSQGELSSFNIPSTIGDNYIIIGIPTHSFVTTPETLVSPFAELVVFMSPRVIAISDKAGVKQTNVLMGDALRDFLQN